MSKKGGPIEKKTFGKYWYILYNYHTRKEAAIAEIKKLRRAGRPAQMVYSYGMWNVYAKPTRDTRL